ncbi:RES family NAD+ phosphorylase [Shouchella patagoniensis]|uniref:RES family NAD+ phosphorylase n=1 Tax=Shouchella patagoniensis TaxID=228576 RepID=UPI001472E96A|nr:RES family NAD+ phosphorylase [Shouchella patagoniensis]
MNIQHNEYTLETRRHFSKLIREIFGDEPRTYTISSINDIYTLLKKLSDKLMENEKKMNYIWWWRGTKNSHIRNFKVLDNFLLLNEWRIEVSEIYVNISPISIFDFIIFRINGSENQEPDVKNYKWRHGSFPIDLSRNNFDDNNIREYCYQSENFTFKQPYNFILTAQFGLPNLKIYTDDQVGFMLNKLLFKEIDYEYFTQWYVRLLTRLKKDVNDFYDHLVEFPMLGLNHNLGQSINEGFKEAYKYHLKNKTFYRARKLEEFKPFDEEGMWHPPSHLVDVFEGRYNHFGQSFLYMAEDEITAFKEVVPEWYRSCSMVKFEIREAVNILDLRRINFYEEDIGLKYIIIHYMLVHEGTVSQEIKNSHVKPEYLVPRFVADCARSHNYDGIIFNSTKTDSYNLVIFEPDKLKQNDKIKILDKPYIYSIN